MARLHAYARVEFGLGGGGWAAASNAGSSFLDLVIDGEEGAQGPVDRGRVGEAFEQVGVEDDDVRSLLEQVGVLAACWCGLRLLHRWLVRPG